MKMKKYLIALVASLFLSLVVAPTQSVAAPEKKVSQVQKAKKPVAKKHVARKHAAKKKNVKHTKKQKHIAAPPVRAAVETPKCQFLFWQVECRDGYQPQTAQVETRVSNTSVPKVIQVAETQIGLSARKDRKVLANKLSSSLGQRVDPARIPWCAAWANMVLADLGMETTGSLMARSFLDWGQATHTPKMGDVVVMRRGRNRYAGHVGFFYGFVEDGHGVKKVAVLGGNQGKQVRISYYPISRVIAYRTA